MRNLNKGLEVSSFDGQFEQNVVIKIGNTSIKNSDYDCEFDIQFGENIEAKKAEIIIYNLPKTGISIKTDNAITVSAGYGTNVKTIFSGTIISVKSKTDDLDRVTTIKAVDYVDMQERDINITYAKNTKASKILKDLCTKTGKPIAKFKVNTARDFAYSDQETIDGGLMSNIERLAGILGVQTFIINGYIYVSSYFDFRTNNSIGTVGFHNGLIDIDTWGERTQHGIYKDYRGGYEATMLLNNQISTLKKIGINPANTALNFNYTVYVLATSGSHQYDGEKMITKIKGDSV